MNYLIVDRDRAAESYRAAVITGSDNVPESLERLAHTQRRIRESRAAGKNYSAAEIRARAFSENDPATVSKLFAQAASSNAEADDMGRITLNDSALVLQSVTAAATPEALGEHALQVMMMVFTERGLS